MSSTEHRLETRTLRRNDFTEFFLTGAVGASGDSVRQVLEWAATSLAQKRIQPIQERIYGTLADREEVLALRDSIYARAGLNLDGPPTYLEGQPLCASGMAGLQIWGVAGETVVQTIPVAGAAAGRCWHGPGFRMFYFPLLDGRNPDGRYPAEATLQAESMFRRAGEVLKANGLSYRHVARTWIYLSRLLDWYGDFNGVRTAYYTKEGFGTGPNDMPYPASTGIQGRHGEEECFLSLLAIDAEPSAELDVRCIQRTCRQDRASSYGSAFSRGVCIDLGGRRTIHVSGTASIDENGKTLYQDNAEAQILETLMNVAALLQDQGGGLESLSSGTLFCKTREVYESYRSVLGRLRIPQLPVVPMIADVCRDDLLVELEAIAIV